MSEIKKDKKTNHDSQNILQNINAGDNRTTQSRIDISQTSAISTFRS